MEQISSIQGQDRASGEQNLVNSGNKIIMSKEQEMSSFGEKEILHPRNTSCLLREQEIMHRRNNSHHTQGTKN
jgi:hypothetical protein